MNECGSDNIQDINSLTQYIKQVVALEDSNQESSHGSFESMLLHPAITTLWYRGESKCYNDRLKPRIFRESCIKPNIEERIFYYGMHMYDHMLPVNVKQSHIDEQLIFFQHHGSPTRLLDWSLNPLVALFFAVQEENDSDGYVYILNPRKMNRQISFGTYGKNGFLVDGDDFNAIARVAFIRSTCSKRKDAKEMLIQWLNNIHLLMNMKGKVFDYKYFIEQITNACKVSELAICKNSNNCSKVLENHKERISKKYKEYMYSNVPFVEKYKQMLESIYHANKDDIEAYAKCVMHIYSTPVAFYPKWSFHRMYHQMSVFTLGGGCAYAKNDDSNNEIEHIVEYKKYVRQDNGEWIIKTIKIPSDVKANILKQLRYIGINKFSMFMDDIGDGIRNIHEVVAAGTKEIG